MSGRINGTYRYQRPYFNYTRRNNRDIYSKLSSDQIWYLYGSSSPNKFDFNNWVNKYWGSGYSVHPALPDMNK